METANYCTFYPLGPQKHLADNTPKRHKQTADPSGLANDLPEGGQYSSNHPENDNSDDRQPGDPPETEKEERQDGFEERAAILEYDAGLSREEAEKRADAPREPRARPAARTGGATAATARAGNPIDLTKVTIPVLAINGELDRPFAKTFRMWRELDNFTNVVLPGKSHLTAIVGGYIPPEYGESLVQFIDANDPK